jgi:hypothetical protein
MVRSVTARARVIRWLFLLVLYLSPAFFSVEAQTASSAVVAFRDTRAEDVEEFLRVADHQYQGLLRLYIVEPVSRYVDYYGTPFDFGFLGFALNQPITVTYRDTIDQIVAWSGSALAANNVMVIAVLFSSVEHQAWSNPATQSNPFMAHWVDAAASAVPGTTGSDSSWSGYTHTVFLEEATDHG